MKKISILLILFFTFGYTQTDNNKKLKNILETGDCNLLDFKVNEEDLKGLEEKELIILMNMPVAKYGKKFKTKWIGEHFKQYSWFKPQYDDVAKFLKDFETDNIKLINKYIEKLKKALTAFTKTEDFIGKFSLRGRGGDCPDEYFYRLCSNGNYIVIKTCTNYHFYRGKWSFTNGEVIGNHNIYCYLKCSGKVRQTEEGNGVCLDKEYPTCESISGSNITIISKSYIDRWKDDSDNWSPDDMPNPLPMFDKFKKKEPKQCSDDYVPKTIDDLKEMWRY